MSQVWYLGPAGALQEIAGPKPDLTVGGDHGSARSLITGLQFVQTKRRPRTYPLSWGYLTAAELSVIEGLQAGLYGPGPFRLVDPQRRNRLPADVSAVLDLTLFTATAGTVAEGTPMIGERAVQWTVPASTGAGARMLGPDGVEAVPVAAGQQLTGSVYVTGSGVSVAARLCWYDAAGVLLSQSTGSGAALTGSYVRRTIAASPPADAAYVAAAVATTTTPGGAATVKADEWQLEEGAAATAWTLGSAIPNLGFIRIDVSYPNVDTLSAEALLVEVP